MLTEFRVQNFKNLGYCSLSSQLRLLSHYLFLRNNARSLLFAKCEGFT